VLSEFTKEDQKLLFARFEQAYDGVLRYLAEDSEAAIRLCNAGEKA
jgi:hypothetical protein